MHTTPKGARHGDGCKKHQGAVGILTNGIFTRAEMWQGPLACALMPFLHPELY